MGGSGQGRRDTGSVADEPRIRERRCRFTRNRTVRGKIPRLAEIHSGIATLFVTEPGVLEQEGRGADADLVGANDLAGGELERARVPVEDLHHPLERRAPGITALDL